jgi:hypothetical protein
VSRKYSLNNAQKLRAAELKKIFAVFGHFYDRKFGDEIIPCREILEIISISDVPYDYQTLAYEQPDLVVVMMNPGSSKPADKKYVPQIINRPSEIVKKRDIIEAKPDNAQYQIMRFMLLNGWTHARILNLSDLRQAQSGVFMETWTDLHESHSIFSKSRKDSVTALIGDPDQILLAWSKEESLLPLAEMASNTVQKFNTVGLSRGENLYAYPSPPLQKHKEAWLTEIYELMSRMS